MREILRKILMGFMIIGFLFGLSILVYPLFANVWNNYRDEQLFQAYLHLSEQENGEETVDYSQLWQDAWDYNDDLQPLILPDSFIAAQKPYTKDEAYTNCLNLTGDGIMGYVYVPKITIRVPIYHSTDTEVLEKGIGHLHGSSLPVGGTDSHCVLAAHRGLPQSSLFTDLDQLVVGDQFYLYVLDEILAYEIDQILIVEPQDTEALQVVQGQDLVTLLTCTPYGVNSHRLLVRGHRVPYVAEQMEAQKREYVPSANTNYIMWVCLGLAMTAEFLVFAVVLTKYIRKRRRRRKKRKNEKH